MNTVSPHHARMLASTNVKILEEYLKDLLEQVIYLTNESSISNVEDRINQIQEKIDNLKNESKKRKIV